MNQIAGLTGLSLPTDFQNITDTDLDTRQEKSVAASAHYSDSFRQRRPDDDVDDRSNSPIRKLPTTPGRVKYRLRLIEGSRTAECRRPT